MFLSFSGFQPQIIPNLILNTKGVVLTKNQRDIFSGVEINR